MSDATEKALLAVQIAAAAATLLSIGGYGEGWLPSPFPSFTLLVLLLAAGALRRRAAMDGWGELARRLMAWGHQRRFWVALGAIAIFALAVRLYGTGDALGHVDAGMDQRRLARSVLDFFQTGRIDHSTVEHYPGIHFWFLSAGFLLTYVWGLMSEIGMRFVRMPVEYFILAGNVISALQGATTVLLTGLLGRRLAGPGVGLVAAGLMAISPLSIDLSMQVRNDPAQVMLLTAAVLVALASYENGRGREAFVAGVLAGLATGVKYSSLFVVIPVILAAATTKDKERRATSSALAIGGFVAALLVSNHFLWADIPNFLRQLSVQIGITGEEHWAAKDNPAAFHVSILARQVVGWPLMIAASGLAAYHLGRGRWRWWLFLSFPLVYIWFTAQRPAQFARWVYPSAPFVAVAAGAALMIIVGFLTTRVLGTDSGHRAARVAFGVLVSLLLTSPIMWAFAHQTSRRLATPTYTLVEKWLEQQAPDDNRLLVERAWLDVGWPRFRLNRVDDLGVTLSGGLYELAANDWIVVHEPHLDHPSLERLELAQRFAGSTSFGGSLGPDFAVYRPPRVEPLALPVSIRLDEPAAEPFLGSEWDPTEAGSEGLLLPTEGASLYLPPVTPAVARSDEPPGARSTEVDGVRLEILLSADRQRSRRSPPIEIGGDGEPLAFELRVGDAEADPVVVLELPDLGPESKVIRLRLSPTAGTGPVRVLGFRLE